MTQFSCFVNGQFYLSKCRLCNTILTAFNQGMKGIGSIAWKKKENTRKKGKVITSYIDIDTGIEIADREYTGDYVGLDYDTFAKEIDGYEFVVELIPANKDGQYTIEDIYVKYYYRKIDNAETGDIAVVAFVTLAVVCVAGIIFVILRNRKKNK